MGQISWVSLNQRNPPAPGKYMVRRDLSRTENKRGERKIKTLVMVGTFDGQGWNLPWTPDFWKDIPTGEGVVYVRV